MVLATVHKCLHVKRTSSQVNGSKIRLCVWGGGGGGGEIDFTAIHALFYIHILCCNTALIVLEHDSSLLGGSLGAQYSKHHTDTMVHACTH